jgi:predicted anti-sigma-YlaC factor YlaD
MLTPVPPTECSRAREAASARLDGELSELELVQLDAHLGRCAACAEYAQLIATTALELRAAALEQPSEPIAIPRLRRRVRLVPAAAAAAVVAGIAASSFALGGAVGSHASHPRPPAAAAATTNLTVPPTAQLPVIPPQELPAEVYITSRVIAV